MDTEIERTFSLQIYNEMIRDLLNPSTGFLDLREDSKGEIQVAGITEVSTVNAREVSYTLLHQVESVIGNYYQVEIINDFINICFKLPCDALNAHN